MWKNTQEVIPIGFQGEHAMQLYSLLRDKIVFR